MSNFISKCCLILLLLFVGNNLEADERGHWNVSADALFWYASEEPTTVWATVLSSKLKSNGIFSIFDAKGLAFDWDFGFRVGAGYTFEYDGWDTQLGWTWFRTDATSTVPTKDHIVLSEFFGGFIDRDFADSAKVNWSILFNMFDWDLGKEFWVSKALSLRPFIGVKGGWIHQSIHSKWHVVFLNDPGDPRIVDFNAIEDLKNNFWGVGPFGGINTKWKWGSSDTRFVSLFGDFSAATLWGTWINRDIYKDPLPRRISTNMKNSDFGALMLRGFLGLGWDADVGKGMTHVTVKVGYEMQIWFNQLRIATFQQLRLHGNLTLQGGTLNCRLDF